MTCHERPQRLVRKRRPRRSASRNSSHNNDNSQSNGRKRSRSNDSCRNSASSRRPGLRLRTSRSHNSRLFIRALSARSASRLRPSRRFRCPNSSSNSSRSCSSRGGHRTSSAFHSRCEQQRRMPQQIQQQQRLPQQEQQQRIIEQQQRANQYGQILNQRTRMLEQQSTQLQQQRRLHQYRIEQQYIANLREQQDRLRRGWDYDNDPYYYSPYTYRYNRGGVYYQTNQYGVNLLQRAVNYGYQEGVLAGQADRQDGWAPDYQNSYAYQDANYGYDGSYVNQADYNYYFRQGFQRGYNDGYYRPLPVRQLDQWLLLDPRQPVERHSRTAVDSMSLQHA